MSDITRYDIDGTDWQTLESAEGEFILSSDYDALQALSVTNILLDVVPGDGMGQEVYAKSVAEVEATLTKSWQDFETATDERDALKHRLAEAQKNAGRYEKLRRWMSSNVADGWSEIEKLAALACYVGWDAFDNQLDALPVCNFGLCQVAEQKCAGCQPSAEDEASLRAGDYTAEELWGGPRPTCPGCIDKS